VEHLPWVLARFSAWIIQTVITASANRRCISRKRWFEMRCGTFTLKWSSADKFDSSQ